MNENLEDGFYWLYKIVDGVKQDPCLVKVYTPQEPPVKGVGFGVWDGAAFIPLSHIDSNSIFEKAAIVPNYAC